MDAITRSLKGGATDRLLGQIKQFEGYRSKPYWDHKQWSVGYGTKASGPNDSVNRSQALTRLQTRLKEDVGHVNRFAPNAPQGTKDALTSLTYNAGSGWMNKGLGRLVKAGKWDAAKRRFQQYNKASGQTNTALVRRRATEASWFGGGSPTLPVGSEIATTEKGGNPPQMDPVTRGLAAISPEWARNRQQFGGDTEGNEHGGPEYSGADEDGVLRGLAAKMIQPYRPGWAALPGVASSIVGGLAARKLRQNEQHRMKGERAAWGSMSKQPPGFGAGMRSTGPMPTGQMGFGFFKK